MLIRLLREYLRPHAAPVAFVACLQLVQTTAALYLPTLNADIINNGVVNGDTGYILRMGGVMLAVTLVQVLAAAAAVYFATRTSMAFGRDLRAAVFIRVQRYSVKEVDQFGTSSLITRTTNDVQQVRLLVMAVLTVVIIAPFTGVGGALMALGQDLPLSMLLLVVLPVLVGVITLVLRRIVPLSAALQARIEEINRLVREQITGVRVIRAFVRDDHERKRFADANDGLTAVALRLGRTQALMMPAMMLVIEFSTIAVLWFGGHRVDDGSMRIGSLVAFVQYLAQILQGVMMANSAFLMAPRAKVSARRVQEVLDTESSVAPPRTPVALPRHAGLVEFKGAFFSYPGAEEPVLRGVDLMARPGETTGVIGSTGSGKTTLLNLVPRLFDTTGGSVLVDGVDVRRIDPAELAKAVGLVPQRPSLFSGTIATNLRFGDPQATEDQLWHALDVAMARDFVERLPSGLDAPVSQGGTNFSGGQRQRLAIARVLVARPKVLLLDDSFSALDYATDAALRAALARETANTTLIVVAQRVATIRDADRIVVLDEGHVVGTGTHEDLYVANQTYREIVLSQLSEQESA